MSVSKVLGAVRQGDNALDEVKLLLSEYQNELPEKQLDRLLRVASLNGQPNTVRLLLDHGAKPDAADHKGVTPILSAVQGGYLSVVEQLVACNADPTLADASGATPLHVAVFCNHCHIARCLLEAGALVDARDANASRPMHVAAMQGSHSMVELLLEHCADLDAEDAAGGSPAHVARLFGHQVLSKYLIQKSKQAAGDLALKAPFKTHELDVAPPASPSLHAPTQPLPELDSSSISEARGEGFRSWEGARSEAEPPLTDEKEIAEVPTVMGKTSPGPLLPKGSSIQLGLPSHTPKKACYVCYSLFIHGVHNPISGRNYCKQECYLRDTGKGRQTQPPPVEVLIPISSLPTLIVHGSPGRVSQKPRSRPTSGLKIAHTPHPVEVLTLESACPKPTLKGPDRALPRAQKPNQDLPEILTGKPALRNGVPTQGASAHMPAPVRYATHPPASPTSRGPTVNPSPQPRLHSPSFKQSVARHPDPFAGAIAGPSEAEVWMGASPAQQSLLHGEYNEAANAMAFQDALCEWRRQGKEAVDNTDHSPSTSNSRSSADPVGTGHKTKARHHASIGKTSMLQTGNRGQHPGASDLPAIQPKHGTVIDQHTPSEDPSGLSILGTKNAPVLLTQQNRACCYNCYKVFASSSGVRCQLLGKEFCGVTCKDRSHSQTKRKCPSCSKVTKIKQGIFSPSFSWFCSELCMTQ